MKELRRLVAISILMVSLFGVALADGGDVQGPPLPPPPSAAECTADCSNSAVTSTAPTSDVTTDLANSVITWLVEAILY
ncbi:MAG TPA: hypothetical protein VF333_02090 [Pyrinomonadaceae bacterium]